MAVEIALLRDHEQKILVGQQHELAAAVTTALPVALPSSTSTDARARQSKPNPTVVHDDGTDHQW